MDKLRVGFIGSGRISDLHAIEYLQNERAELVAVFDLDADIARRCRLGVPGKRVFTDYHEMLALKDLTWWRFLLPHHLHYQATLDAAAAGKHISLQSRWRFNRRSRSDDRRCETCRGHFLKSENFIFTRRSCAQSLIDAGEIGTPLSIRIKSNAAPARMPAGSAFFLGLALDPRSCGGGPWF
jgi:predicted dehydrogenase